VGEIEVRQGAEVDRGSEIHFGRLPVHRLDEVKGFDHAAPHPAKFLQHDKPVIPTDPCKVIDRQSHDKLLGPTLRQTKGPLSHDRGIGGVSPFPISEKVETPPEGALQLVENQRDDFIFRVVEASQEVASRLVSQQGRGEQP
jgi:hypothetical protein